ncbi:MAG: hypothetical protein HeimC2_43860 [Candidatus Heimdallarchaeota archaeon LC_2]|nr:MAG: hypothetical protein HeimC2_43860 [Candidatus Heimdallarchaeota archaeon LC_2]
MKLGKNLRTMLLVHVLVSLSIAVTAINGSDIDNYNVLIIDGRGRSVHLPNIDGWDLVLLQNAPDTIIENLIYNDGNTIFVINSDNLVVRNNIIENANSYALFVEFSDNIQIYNNTIVSGTNDGIISYLNNNVVINNNSISSVVKNGIFARGNNITISNNQINNIEGTGIFIQSSTDLIVENNSINNVDWTPIAPDQTSFDSANFFGNTYNGLPLTLDDINPSISTKISIDTTTQTSSDTGTAGEEIQSSKESTDTKENEISSTNETYFPFLIITFGVVLLSNYRKFKKFKWIN